ncbi:MAG: SRPBCC family protein [Bacteroidota bacterium]|jgi:ligand-binding SRPBCC domain-containing protein
MYTLRRELTVRTSLEEAWSFISRPENLNLITPDDMKFRILTAVPDTMYNGLLIRYSVGIPFLGSQNWLTEIRHIRDHHSFVDEQRIGPYRFWHHRHVIEDTDEGIRFIDEVTYVLPFSVFGRFAHALFVRRMLTRIFDYRAEAIRNYFSPGTRSVTTAHGAHT